jgi:hypothetical protein
MAIKILLRRLLLSATLASIAAMSVVGVAAAHECYNASRNATAEANAADSNAWTWASEILLRFVIPEFVGDPDGLTDQELAAALAIVEAERAAGVEVYALDQAILNRTTAAGGHGVAGTERLADGRGIDHATANLERLEPLVGHLIGVYLAASS